MKLSIPEMNCGHCKAAVTEALIGLDAKAQVLVDIPAREVQLETSASEAEVINALDAIGFDAAVI